jgi:methyl-accepting chemotaxis protein
VAWTSPKRSRRSDWKINLRGAITARSALDVGTVSKDNCCALGKWLHGESKGKFGAYVSHQECTRLHAVFHQQAGKVAAAINDRRHADAEAMLGSGTPT